MNNKVIEVLDYLSEKLGIAVDWTAENVWPQVTEFLDRYRVYAIISDGVWLLISLISVCTIIHLFKTIAKQMHEEAGFWYDDDFWIIGVCIFGVIGLVGFGIAVLFNIFEIIQWAVVPEVQFFEVFKSYLNSAG